MESEMPNDAVEMRPRTAMLRMVTDIVASYVSFSKVASSDLPHLIKTIYQGLDRPSSVERVEPVVPAVSLRKSITPDYLICLEDGAKLKMLKRYLMTNFGMTPEAYREKWGLPRDYPMVAPNYAKRRSELAKESGLGRGYARGGDLAQAYHAGSLPRASAIATRGRGRPRKIA
jgi:predicted transcriptional regulator